VSFRNYWTVPITQGMREWYRENNFVNEGGDHLFLEGIGTINDKATVGSDCKLTVTGTGSKAHKYRLCLIPPQLGDPPHV